MSVAGRAFVGDPLFAQRVARRLGLKGTQPEIPIEFAGLFLTIGVEDLLSQANPKKLRIQNLSAADQAVAAGVDTITTFNNLGNWTPGEDVLLYGARLAFQTNGGLGAWDIAISKGSTWATSLVDDAEGLMHYNVDSYTVAGVTSFAPFIYFPVPILSPSSEAWFLNAIVKNRQAGAYNLTFIGLLLYAPAAPAP